MSICREAEPRRALIAAAVVFMFGTFYFVFSPHPNGTSSTQPQGNVLAGSPVLLCDDPSWGVHRMAVVVPFRDRFDDLLEFVPALHRFLCAQQVRHQIFIINQVDAYR